MQTNHRSWKEALVAGLLLAGSAAFAPACGDDSTAMNGTGGGTFTGLGGGGSTGTGGAAGDDASTGAGGGTGGAGGAGGTTGTEGGTGGSSEGGTQPEAGPMCPASGSYDNTALPLLPDGGLPPL